MKFIPNKISRSIGRKVLTTKKNSPHIFFVSGVIGVGVSTVLACRATLKLEDKLDTIMSDLDTVKQLKNDPSPDSSYPEEKYYKDLGYVYVKSAVSLGKLYGPSLLIGGASIAALTGAHVQLTRRNTALTATLAVVSKAYEEYRIRVQNEIGEERELDIYNGVIGEKVEGEGKNKDIRKIYNLDGLSPYARFFDEFSREWRKDAEHNRIFIECQQRYANHLLNSRGHVFLNEVYDALGLDRTTPGQVVGWVRDGDGDGYIDFGLTEESSARFMSGAERSVLLDFNVDGVVYDKI